MPHWIEHPVIVTLVLLAALCAIFLRGFSEAIGLAVVLVVVYLCLNVDRHRLGARAHRHATRSCCRAGATCSSCSTAAGPMMAVVSLLLFPKLALGLSGFETGVAVMPLVKGDPDDTPRATRRAASAARAGCCSPRR